MGWGVCTQCGVSKRVGDLVNGMDCYCPGWGVSKRDRVLLTGMRC